MHEHAILNIIQSCPIHTFISLMVVGKALNIYAGIPENLSTNLILYKKYQEVHNTLYTYGWI